MSEIRTIETWHLQRFHSPRSGRWRAVVVGECDGESRTTSVLAGVEGGIVTTYSGSRYRLGTPSRMLLDHVKHEGGTFDPAAPLSGLGPRWAFDFKKARQS